MQYNDSYDGYYEAQGYAVAAEANWSPKAQQTNDMEKLRKCKVSYLEGEIFYFHRWVDVADKRLHPVFRPLYANTKALLENPKTGEVYFEHADAIIFIDKIEEKHT